MDVTKLQAISDTVFANLNQLPILRRLPFWTSALNKYQGAVNHGIADIAAKIPDGAPTNVIVDAIFAYLETVFKAPWEHVILEALRIAADALFASPPVV